MLEPCEAKVSRTVLRGERRETQYDIVMIGNPSSFSYSVVNGHVYRQSPVFTVVNPPKTDDEGSNPWVFSFTPEDLGFRIQVKATRMAL